MSSHPIQLKWRFLEILLLLVIVSLGALFVLRIGMRVDRRMEELKTEVVHVLESKIGRKISYENISPSVFGYLGIRGLVIYSLDDPDDVMLQINRVKVYYNLFRFLFIRTPVLAVSEIQIANSNFDIDYERDRELLELLDSLRTGSSASGGSLPSFLGRSTPREAAYPQIDISGTNITLRYSYADWQVEVSNLFFTVTNQQDLYDLAVRGHIQARHTRRESPLPAWLSTRVKITGTLDRFFTWSDLALRIYSLSTDTINVKRQTLQVSYDSKGFEVRKIQDRAPLDVQVSYDTLSKDLLVRFTAEEFRPADLFQLTGSLEHFNPYLLSSVSSSGSVAVNIDELHLKYAADLRIVAPAEVVPFDISIVSHFSGNEEILYLSPFALESSRGRVEFVGNVLVGNLLPSGLLRFDDFDPLGGKNLNATLRIERDVQLLTVESSTLSLGQTSFGRFTLSMTPEAKNLGFAMDAALGADPDLGSFAAIGEFGWESGLTLNTEARLNNLPLDTLYELLVPEIQVSPRLQQQLTRYSLSMAAEASTDFVDFTLSSDLFEIVEKDRPQNFVRLQALMNRDTVELRDVRFQWEDYSLNGDVEVERVEETLELSTLFWFEEIPYQLDIDFLPRRSVRFSGSYGLEGYYLLNQTAAPVLLSGRITQLWGNPFQLRSENLPIALTKGTIYASVDVNGLVGSGGSIYTTASTARVRNLPFSTIKKNTLDVEFALYDDQLFLNRIAYQDEFSSLSGSGSAQLQDLLPFAASGSIDLRSPEGEEAYTSSASIEANRIDGRFEFIRAPIERLGIRAVIGNISGSITMEGTLPRPDLSILLSLNNGRLNLDPLGLNLAATYSRDAVQLSSLNASLLTHRIEGGNGHLDLETGAFQFQSGYRSEYFERVVNTQVDLQGNMEGLPWPLTLEQVLKNDIRGVLTLGDITLDGLERPDWIVDLEGVAGVLAFNGGPGDSIEGTVGRDGSFTLNLTEPLPIQGRAKGRIIRNQLDSDFVVTALDMRMINTMTPTTDVFTFTMGTARGSLRIFGPINDPDLVGYLDVVDAELLFEPSPDPVKPINGQLVFEGKSFTLPRTTSYSGDTKIEGEGFFYIDHWVPEGVELIFYADEYPGVHIAYAFDPIFVDGYATGAVRIRADTTTSKLDGKIQANSCRIALLREEEQQAPSNSVPPVPMSVDMDITTGRSVEFFWPAMNFPIVRTFARQGERVALYVNEETSEFFMEGEVEIRGGEIFYFDRSFYLKQGSISFEERFDEFDPWIYALAEIRERDLNNEEIKIYLEANNKISLFSPRFYSEPSRPDVEILNLIGGTILNRFEQTDFGTAAVMLTSDIISQFGILTPFERAVREVLNLDLFTVRTQFLQNVLLGKIRGENLVENSFNPLDNTTLTLGKYLGTDLFLEALVRFQTVDDFTTSSNIRTEGELNLEWVTPFFLLEWTFTPTHPENLFLSDNSIGLSWKYSY
ncbi:MAG: translocation/assembly module TamB domain-containing protein [Spirochaetaceae bacterium]|nr:MAG: translocation/assembly module TamB domain-containing protein [Spirochaetaceae bacterium]